LTSQGVHGFESRPCRHTSEGPHAETHQGNDFDYTGLHAFAFIDGVDPGRNVADVIEDIGASRAASSPTGG
jgi:hypothetical protein